MSTQLTDRELDQLRRLVKDFRPAKAAIASLEQHDGRLDASFDALCAQRVGVPLIFPTGSPQSFWCVTLSGLQLELCQSKEFQKHAQDYHQGVAKAPAFKALVNLMLDTSGMPLDPAMATLLAWYILKLGLAEFCQSS